VSARPWPAMMRRATAAAYCDLSVAEFEREIAAGNLPQPVTLGNHGHWSKSQLDQALAVLTGEAQKDWRIGSPLYGDKAA
jgi:predicted DNA-binding transcriptional regulator AlpA